MHVNGYGICPYEITYIFATDFNGRGINWLNWIKIEKTWTKMVRGPTWYMNMTNISTKYGIKYTIVKM